MFEQIEPAKHDELTDAELDLVSGGDRSVTHGGFNTNDAKGPFTSADQQ